MSSVEPPPISKTRALCGALFDQGLGTDGGKLRLRLAADDLEFEARLVLDPGDECFAHSPPSGRLRSQPAGGVRPCARRACWRRPARHRWCVSSPPRSSARSRSGPSPRRTMREKASTTVKPEAAAGGDQQPAVVRAEIERAIIGVSRLGPLSKGARGSALESALAPAPGPRARRARASPAPLLASTFQTFRGAEAVSETGLRPEPPSPANHYVGPDINSLERPVQDGPQSDKAQLFC